MKQNHSLCASPFFIYQSFPTPTPSFPHSLPFDTRLSFSFLFLTSLFIIFIPFQRLIYRKSFPLPHPSFFPFLRISTSSFFLLSSLFLEPCSFFYVFPLRISCPSFLHRPVSLYISYFPVSYYPPPPLIHPLPPFFPSLLSYPHPIGPLPHFFPSLFPYPLLPPIHPLPTFFPPLFS